MASPLPAALRQSDSAQPIQPEAGARQSAGTGAEALVGACRRRNHELRLGVARQCMVEGSDHSLDFTRFTSGPYARFGKRCIDLLAASTGLVLVTPVLLIVAAAIRLDSPGPALFKQMRTGLWGRRFAMYKFRTMVNDAEARKAELIQFNVHGTDSPDFKVIDDPRITRVGKWLRRTSLDELPNLFNVLLGQMSLVGPRPTSFHGETYDFQHLPRLAVKPGITGLWQVSGRADVDFDERTQLDITYINNFSLLYDLKLLFRTLISSNRGAY